MTKIAIIGAGYIGNHLAKALFSKKKFQITAVLQNIKEKEEVDKFTQKTIILTNGKKSDLKPIIENNDFIILTISANKHYTYEEIFLKTANLIKENARTLNKPKRLIYTSRCIIYGEKKGLWVDENAPLNPLTSSSKVLLETEKILLSLKEYGWKTCIFRLAEVYGKYFELSQKIKKRSDYFMQTSGDYYTNMIHLEDIINAIIYAIEHKLEGIYNLADDDHQTQKELLQKISGKFNLPEITWQKEIEKKIRGNYRVSNYKIKKMGYDFIHPTRVIS